MIDASRPVRDDGTIPAPTIRLDRWVGSWAADDPYAQLKVDVVTYGHLDPVATLATLSDGSGIPLGALVRYGLARWASGGSESLLELGVSGVDHLARTIRDAEEADSDDARLAAYEVVREVVGWLRAGLGDGADDGAGAGDDLGDGADTPGEHATTVCADEPRSTTSTSDR